MLLTEKFIGDKIHLVAKIKCQKTLKKVVDMSRK